MQQIYLSVHLCKYHPARTVCVCVCIWCVCVCMSQCVQVSVCLSMPCIILYSHRGICRQMDRAKKTDVQPIIKNALTITHHNRNRNRYTTNTRHHEQSIALNKPTIFTHSTFADRSFRLANRTLQLPMSASRLQ